MEMENKEAIKREIVSQMYAIGVWRENASKVANSPIISNMDTVKNHFYQGIV